MTDKNELMLANSIDELQTHNIDLNMVKEQFIETKRLMSQIGIRTATFDTGMQYDKSDNRTSLATNGLMVVETEHTMTIVMTKENSNKDDIVNELNTMSNINQKELGAIVGRSQPWVSNILSNSSDNE